VLARAFADGTQDWGKVWVYILIEITDALYLQYKDGIATASSNIITLPGLATGMLRWAARDRKTALIGHDSIRKSILHEYFFQEALGQILCSRCSMHRDELDSFYEPVSYNQE
jgi:hypothetical protein